VNGREGPRIWPDLQWLPQVLAATGEEKHERERLWREYAERARQARLS
jgi:hypothetical protein